MAIHVMTNADDATYIVEADTARAYGWDTEKSGPLYMKVMYEGCVLATGEMNGYDDSDFYAVVYNQSENRITRYTYGSTRFWTYPNSAKVDATPDVIAAAEKWLYEQRVEYNTWKNEVSSRVIDIGKQVKVIKGRKIPVGTTGEVISIKQNNYNENNPQVMIRHTKDGKLAYTTTYMQNLEVINPEQYLAPMDEVIEKSRREAKTHNWRGATSAGYPVI